MDLLAELRRRLDVPTSALSDELLDHMLDVSLNALTPWLIPTTVSPNPYQANVDEATVQLAVKLVDASPRGLVDADGYLTPTMSATPGLVRAVFGALGPALAKGGLSV